MGLSVVCSAAALRCGRCAFAGMGWVGLSRCHLMELG